MSVVSLTNDSLNVLYFVSNEIKRFVVAHQPVIKNAVESIIVFVHPVNVVLCFVTDRWLECARGTPGAPS